jgi:Histidine phosphatase superfamily (branch 1)
VTRALVALLAVLALAGCGGGDETEPLTGRDTLVANALREGGVVLVLRHTKTETATDEVEVLGDCSQQRNLSDEGREQARALGRDMRALGVPVQTVMTSPLCRAKETAELLGLARPIVTRPLVSPGVVGTAEDDDRRIRILRDRLATFAAPGKVTVLVTHTGNIGGAFDQSIEEGDALVLRDGNLLGVVTPGDWARLKAGLD